MRLPKLCVAPVIAVAFSGTARSASVEFDTKYTSAIFNVVKVEALHVSEKDDRYAVDVKLTNVHDQPIALHFHDVKCFRGDKEGVLDAAGPQKGSDALVLAPMQVQPYKLDCKLQTHTVGDIRIVFGQILEDPGSKATEVAGKELAKGIEIKVSRPRPS